MVAGSTVEYDRTSNCRPYRGCDVHRPVSRRLSPTCAPSSGPTTVSRSVPLRSVATRAIVYPVSSFAKVIRSRTASSTDSTPAPPSDWRVFPTTDIVPQFYDNAGGSTRRSGVQLAPFSVHPVMPMTAERSLGAVEVYARCSGRGMALLHALL